MIPESEWKFFEATEQRIRHLTGHQRENEAALLTGRPLPWDPVDLVARQAALVQEMDYASRVEQALAGEPTPEQARHLDLHQRWILGSLFETHPDIAPLLHHLNTTFAAFTPQINGRDATRAEIRRILASAEDRDLREAAWNAYIPLGEELIEPLREIFRLREALARAVVETGYPEVALHAVEQDRRMVVVLVDEFERFTRTAHDELRREVERQLGLHEVEAWDIEYGLGQMSPLTPDLFSTDRAAGDLIEMMDRWGFDPAFLKGFAEEADLPMDILRLTAENPAEPRYLIRAADGFEAWRIAFRAAGQALRDVAVRGRRHFLDEESPVMIEAAGMILESALRRPGWLETVTGAPGPAARAHLRAHRLTRIHQLRRHAATGMFENLVYAQGDLDPQRLFAEVHEHLLAHSRGARAIWATYSSFVSRPLAGFAKVLAAMAAAQTVAHLESIVPDP